MAHIIVLAPGWKLPERRLVLASLREMGLDYYIHDPADPDTGPCYIYPVERGDLSIWHLTQVQAAQIGSMTSVESIVETAERNVPSTESSIPEPVSAHVLA